MEIKIIRSITALPTRHGIGGTTSVVPSRCKGTERGRRRVSQKRGREGKVDETFWHLCGYEEETLALLSRRTSSLAGLFIAMFSPRVPRELAAPLRAPFFPPPAQPLNPRSGAQHPSSWSRRATSPSGTHQHCSRAPGEVAAEWRQALINSPPETRWAKNSASGRARSHPFPLGSGDRTEQCTRDRMQLQVSCPWASLEAEINPWSPVTASLGFLCDI